MDALQDFHFLRPYWFFTIVPLLLVLALLWFNRKRETAWTKIISPHLLPFLMEGEQSKSKPWPMLALSGAWLLGIFALAGPVWSKLPQPVEKSAEALVICWDISPSMLAEDIKPSRLDRSRLKLIDLLTKREDGQTALVAYSGEAYTVAPLTDDVQTLVNLLPALSPTTLPSVGSNPEMALETAIKLLSDAGVAKGHIVMATDGVDPSAFPRLERLHQNASHSVTFWGIGTEDGAPIPLPSGGFAKQASGNIVVAKLNENEMRQFASRTGQFYIPMTSNDSDIRALTALFTTELDQTQKTDRVFDQWFEHGQYLSLLLLLCVLPFFRRGLIFCLIGAPLFLFDVPAAKALTWEDLWKTQNQQAESSLQSGDKGAVEKFTTPELRGQAHYQQDNFEAAAKAFEQGSSALHHYNRGTALAKANQYEAAIQAFDEALELDNTLTKARDNKAIAEKLLAHQNAQQQSQEQSQDQQNSQDQDQQGEQQNSEQQNDQQGQQGEQSQQQNGQQNTDQSQQNASQESSEASDGSEENQQTAQQNEAASDEDTENPYAKAADEQEQAEEDAQLAAKQEESENGETSEETDEQQLAQQNAVQMVDQAPTEEEQKLEQWLRKVPDDPSGLLRNKFKHQYQQRRRTMQGANNPAEKRW